MGYRKLSTAVKAGSRLDQLKALASILAKRIDNCESMRDLASLARQYRETIQEIEDIEGTVEQDDEIGQILQRRNADGQPGAVRKNRA